MAYYIFLKSLRSLEEFRKNPHVKIPPKSPYANFQSLGKFRNPIINSEILFPCFRPGRPCGTRPLVQPAPLASLLLRAEFNLAGPASPRVDGVFEEVCFPFWFAPSELAASFSSLCQVGSGCQIRLPPPLADRCHFLSSPPASPRRPTSDLVMPGEVFTPRLYSPLNFTP
jgi:hypothetical protein